MLIRLRSSEGTTRIEVQLNDSIHILKEQGAKQFNVDPIYCVLARDIKGEYRLPDAVTVSSLGIKNGDLIYLLISKDQHPRLNMSAATYASSNIPSSPPEDDVDIVLDQQDGLIHRSRDTRACLHGPNGMCEQCSPLEPYDAEYLKSHGIKHTSFHAHLKQIRTNQRHDNVALEMPDYRLRSGCTDHPPWPRGICTKCQPSAVTLQQQSYRMVDHVEFESATIVDVFLQPWRKTGAQRFGYLLGRYEVYPEVPLGIKAVVSAIYEPNQAWHAEGIELIEEEGEKSKESVEAVCKLLHLQYVGMIYTDLTDDDTNRGKVEYKRHLNTWFLSCSEIIYSAHMQCQYPSASRYSESGYFGSKFVTVVVSGDQEGNISLSSYQVSNQAMAMYEANMLEASVDPSVMRIQQASQDEKEKPPRFIPEVFFKVTNEYNVQVTRPAKPTFPVEYLLVTLTHGFPNDPHPLFLSEIPFPIEHRDQLQAQNLDALRKHLKTQTMNKALSDFHLLYYLAHTGFYDMAVDFPRLCQAVYEQVDENKLLEVLNKSVSWQTLSNILQENQWNCQACSFVNQASEENCTICQTPKYGGQTSVAMEDVRKVQMTTWTCPVCTLINEYHATCEACGTNKPVDLE